MSWTCSVVKVVSVDIPPISDKTSAPVLCLTSPSLSITKNLSTSLPAFGTVFICKADCTIVSPVDSNFKLPNAFIVGVATCPVDIFVGSKLSCNLSLPW